MDVDGVSVLARGITARGPEGTVFENVDLRVSPGSLAVVCGPGGTGRTSLLLALSGRLRLVAGHLEVSGHVLPAQARAVRRLVLPARLRPGYELEERHRVREAVAERRLISGVPISSIADAFDLLGIDPNASSLVGELPADERLLLAVALTAASAPAGIVVDDVDVGLGATGRSRAWAALRGLAGTGMTVLTSATDPPFGDVEVIPLPAQVTHRPTPTLVLEREEI